MFSEHPHARIWAVAVMALAAATDKLDGVVARRWGQSTRWGHILDPVADKIAAGGVIVVLLLLGAVPVWFVVLALGRDVAILVSGVWLRFRKGVLLPPNRTGKWAVGITALALALLVLETGGAVTGIVLAAASVLLVTSWALYAARFLRVLRGAMPPEALLSRADIRNPISDIHNPQSTIRNPQSMIRNP
jgi:CDP-diacylglycerol--glycerol-3-phosphate 3-phosphatidyltransferase